ncbi:ParA family protein [Acinetobacter gandensis]|uniref:ParA family protein n=2 Tax=Acinetobacter TaxID=469 RepID=UPI0015D28ECB
MEKNIGKTYVLASAHFKGGVGKTTSTVNSAVLLGKMGYKVLVIDLDNQRNATKHISTEAQIDKINLTLRDIFEQYKTINPYDVIIGPEGTNFENVSLIACDKNIRDVEINIQRTSAVPNEILRRVLKKIEGDFDFIILDCPPRMETLTYNAFLASNSIILPLDGEYSIQGLEDILYTMDDMETSNPNLKILAPILNFYKKRNIVDMSLAEDIREEFSQENVLNRLVHKDLICIPNATVFEQASYLKSSIFDIDTNEDTPATLAIKSIVEMIVNEYKKL